MKNIIYSKSAYIYISVEGTYTTINFETQYPKDLGEKSPLNFIFNTTQQKTPKPEKVSRRDFPFPYKGFVPNFL